MNEWSYYSTPELKKMLRGYRLLEEVGLDYEEVTCALVEELDSRKNSSPQKRLESKTDLGWEIEQAMDYFGNEFRSGGHSIMEQAEIVHQYLRDDKNIQVTLAKVLKYVVNMR